MKKALIVSAALFLVPTAALAEADGPTLAKDRGCLACHSVDQKIVGPAYKDVARKYAGDKTAEAKLVKKIKEGGQGVWGSIPMPPNGTVSEPELHTLAKWILSLK